MKTLQFIRHTESVANVGNLLGGQSDFALSEKGIRDASVLAELFAARYSVDTIISSPLMRARQTADPFSDLLGLEVTLNAALLEQNIGVFSGWSYPAAEADPRYEPDRTKRWDWTPPGGESYRQMADRIRPFFTAMEALPNGSRILCFTHAVTLRIIVGLLENTLPVYPTALVRNGELLSVDYTSLGTPHVLRSEYYGDQLEGRE